VDQRIRGHDEAPNCTTCSSRCCSPSLACHSTFGHRDPNQSDRLPELAGASPVAERLEALPNIAVVRLAARISSPSAGGRHGVSSLGRPDRFTLTHPVDREGGPKTDARASGRKTEML